VETLVDAPKQEERKFNLRFTSFEAKEGEWRAPKSRGETKLKVSQSQVAESRLGSTLPFSNSKKG
jgi:hypothetical protein